MAIATSYSRPVQAELVVQLENGESWRATEDDLEKFHLIRGADAYQTLMYALDVAVDNSENNTVLLARKKDIRNFLASVLVPNKGTREERDETMNNAARILVRNMQEDPTLHDLLNS